MKNYLSASLLILIFILIFVPDVRSEWIWLVVSLFLLSLFGAYYTFRNYFSRLDELETNIQKIFDREFKSINELKLNGENELIRNDFRILFAQLKRVENKVKTLSTARSQFLSNVSHELRTPLFAIQGYIETLLDGAMYDEKVNKQFLEKAHKHVMNLNDLLNDLIDISMIEAGEMLMSIRYFNLFDYLNNILDEMNPIASAKGKNLILHPFSKKLEILGDKERLKNVLTNLISNAVKYNPRDLIEIIVKETKYKAVISVKDNGMGIPEEEVDRIFERLYRTKLAKGSSISGTGLGLAIAKHIIGAHGSQIKVKTEIGKGSEFYFELSK